MLGAAFGAGLVPRIPSPPVASADSEEVITEEAGLTAADGQKLRIRLLVEEGAEVAQGEAIACLRDTPEVQLVAPIPCRVVRADFRPGHILSEILLFREAAGDVVRISTDTANSPSGLRHLLLKSGFWPWLRRRPFGGMPSPGEEPAAIFVMATDTRPLAPDPAVALAGREAAFATGLDALARLTDGPVFVCHARGARPASAEHTGSRVRAVECGPRHPQGLAGIQIYNRYPADISHAVWDVHAEDVAALGDLLETGRLPMTRYTAIAGPALRESRYVRTQSGADLRELTRRLVHRGAHVLMSGSPLDGQEAHWLAPRHRQVSVMKRRTPPARPHWLAAALTGSGTPRPFVPTAALSHAFGKTMPAAAFLRALGSGDEEAVMKLGGLSLLEEDLALADYALGGEALAAAQLRAILARIQAEYAT